VRAGEVRYDRGAGSGLHFQDYDAGGTAQFGFVVTAPIHERARGDADSQAVLDTEAGLYGGYAPALGGFDPWTDGADPDYVTGRPSEGRIRHAVAESAAAATALCAGAKTYPGAVNVAPSGRQLSTVAHEAQRRGMGVGVVTNVPLSHATPAAAYAHNATRGDYQDIARDLLGLPSVSHPDLPLPGMDVVIGCGHGVEARRDANQGRNYVPGNRYVAEEDLARLDASNGGPYVLIRRRTGVPGAAALAAAAAEAARTGRRLLALYGVPHGGGHLPYSTANGDYRPVAGRSAREVYTPADLEENPTLVEMTAAALAVLGRNERGFWLMVEAGDVDWANHDANLDNSIGAVLAGDDAVRVVTDWVESHGGWGEALLIVTADHGHYLVLEDPGGLLGAAPPEPRRS
jgi:alkaline phosphatase